MSYYNSNNDLTDNYNKDSTISFEGDERELGHQGYDNNGYDGNNYEANEPVRNYETKTRYNSRKKKLSGTIKFTFYRIKSLKPIASYFIVPIVYYYLATHLKYLFQKTDGYLGQHPVYSSIEMEIRGMLVISFICLGLIVGVITNLLKKWKFIGGKGLIYFVSLIVCFSSIYYLFKEKPTMDYFNNLMYVKYAIAFLIVLNLNKRMKTFKSAGLSIILFSGIYFILQGAGFTAPYAILIISGCILVVNSGHLPFRSQKKRLTQNANSVTLK